MSDSYNNRPYRSGFLQSFKEMPPTMLDAMAKDLGLAMPVPHLATYRNHFKKLDFRYTVDEMYLADSLYCDMQNAEPKYYFNTLSSSDSDVREAFSDLMEKRRAMCDTTPVTLDSLVRDYNSYLCETGYDDGAAPKYTVAPIKNTVSPATTMKYRTVGSFLTHSTAQYAIARITKPSRFCTDPNRIRSGSYGHSALSVILVKLSDSPLMYELLADVMNAIPALSNNITYVAPVARKGVIRSLAELNTGFTINMDAVTNLFPELDRPYMLAKPMSAAMIITPALASGTVLQELRRMEFECEPVGISYAVKSHINVSYKGFSHTVDVTAMRQTVITRAFNAVYSASVSSFSSKIAEGVSVNVFGGCDFQAVYTGLAASIEEMKKSSPDSRLAAYVCIPFTAGIAGDALFAFLPVYRALAESAIPIRHLSAFGGDEKAPSCVFITRE